MACVSDDTISNYVAGSLSAAEVALVKEHAGTCERCRLVIGALLASPTPHAVVTPARAPADDVQRLMHALGQHANRIGQTLAGKYRLERELGSGGMGVVYEAVNQWTKRRVALKLLRPHFSKDAEMVRRFLREARAASHISHPNVVDILDLGQDGDGSLFMVQEFLVGRTLRQRLDADTRLSEAEARAILLPIMDALATAHGLGIVHRDVKPENIFLAESEGAIVPTLIDFGVSKRSTPDSLDPATTTQPIGTPLYMSPEQLRANADLDGRADVWAMGVVLYEALAGRRPFIASNASDIVAQVLTGRAPPLTASPALASLVARALEPDRERRFASVQAMADAWRAAPLAPGTPTPTTPARSRTLARNLSLGIALLLALAATVVMVVMILSRHSAHH